MKISIPSIRFLKELNMDKYCKCGCGQKTQLSWNKKRYNDYINHHSSKNIKWNNEEIEQRQISRIYGDLKRIIGMPIDYDYPLCLCGCGKKVKHKNHKYITNHQPSSMGMLGKKLSEEALQKISKIHIGIKFTEERKQKISKSMSGDNNPMYGKKLSDEHKQKLKGKVPWNKGKKGTCKHSPETKFKRSISIVKYINEHLRNGKKVTPMVGNNEIPIINQIENILNIAGISNDKNLFLKCGKWPDRYYEKYNLCVDVLENHHFKSTGELSDNDKNRQIIIAWKLGCMIYYIPEQEFLKNPEKEIQRFKDFLTLLDQSSN